MRTIMFYVLNSITLYRLITSPVLIILAILEQFDIFKWLLLVSFFTDAIDGFIARKYKITSKFGARLDSIADDSAIFAAIIGMCIWNGLFLIYQIIPVIVLLLLYVVQNALALRRYRRPTSFHTYLAKTAAVSQAAFILTFFFLPEPLTWLFYISVALTTADLLEEIILVIILPGYRTNVKGLYWVLSRKRLKKISS